MIFAFVAVKISVKSRKVMVKGPRGSLTREFHHLPVEMTMVDAKKLKVTKWFGNRRELAAVNTVCSHVENLQKGVTLVSLPSVQSHGDVAGVVEALFAVIDNALFTALFYMCIYFCFVSSMSVCTGIYKARS